MYTPYLLVMTMFSGASELVDPAPHASLASCEAELVRMREAVEDAWAADGILRTSGECREHGPSTGSREAAVRPTGRPALAAAD